MIIASKKPNKVVWTILLNLPISQTNIVLLKREDSMKWLISVMVGVVIIASVNTAYAANITANNTDTIKSQSAPEISLPIAAAWMYMSDDLNYKNIPPAWEKINFKKVDVLLVGPAGIQKDGTFGLYNSKKTGDLANRFKWIIRTARTQNPGIKIIISQWWGNGDNNWGNPLSVLKTDASITKYTDSVITFLQSYSHINGGIDGYDVDYEDNNVSNNISKISSQIRTKMDALSKVNDGRLFYLTLSPASVSYVKSAVPWLNFVNMQTYAGARGLSPQDFLSLGVKPQQLLYGICPETSCGTPTIQQAENQYTQYKLAGIHVWRLNSGNYIEEGKTQEIIYNFLHRQE